MTLAELLAQLWADYVQITPRAEHIHALLGARGERIVTDHIALRGLSIANVGMRSLSRPFEALGFVQQPDRYRFVAKKILASYWRHPDPAIPKIFISELCVDELSQGAQEIFGDLVVQLPPGYSDRDDLPYARRPWSVTREQYEALLGESEYAAWVAAFGFRVNHFTVAVNNLRTFAGLPELNAFLVRNGFQLNTSGGTIKGSPTEKLEQSSTRADAIAVDLGGETLEIPSCYYEFAKRYDGFAGFVEASADKIFESTDVSAAK